MLLSHEVRARLGRGKTALNQDQKEKLCPPWVHLGARRVALPADEVEALLQARIGGASQDQIKELVKRLVAQRAARFQALDLPSTESASSKRRQGTAAEV